MLKSIYQPKSTLNIILHILIMQLQFLLKIIKEVLRMNDPQYIMSQKTLNPDVARNLSHTSKSLPMMEEISPRWLLSFLPWVSVEAGIYRLTKIKKMNFTDEDDVQCGMHSHKICSGNLEELDMPQGFADFEERSKEYILSVIQTVLSVNTRVSDIFNSPINQLNEQIRLTIEAMRERQEWEIINNREFGLTNVVSNEMRISTRKGPPTPDDMDELISRVWKKPAFFLAHPLAIAAFGRECTRRGVPPVTVNLFGSPFITWRGIPIIPSDKMPLARFSKSKCGSGMSSILLMRVGEKERGVIGLHQTGIPDESHIPSLSVKLGGIDSRGVASYLMSLYFSAGVLSDDALGILENVEVGNFYEY
jgi:hypothetical protein